MRRPRPLLALSVATSSLDCVPADGEESILKVLVATTKTQGQRSTDFNYCIEGELVWLSEPCATDARRLPNSCGCGRSFAGLASHRATTTGAIADLPITPEEYEEALRSGLVGAGWPGGLAGKLAAEQAAIASYWATDCVLERDLDALTLRTPE